MTKYFLFREIAIQHPSNRGRYEKSSVVLSTPFKKENRLSEIWAGMYMFKTDSPTEGDPTFGNFYLEIDEEDFSLLREKMLCVVDYLSSTYGITRDELNFQVTNRSIWLSIAAKTFGSFGCKDLHKIHKEMANEINQHLLKSGYIKGLDLSIYRWNGLMRTLGSFLPKSKRWVTKFSLSNLEDSYSFNDLVKSKFDNYFTFDDLVVNQKAANWFEKAKKSITGTSFKTKQRKTLKTVHQGMEEFIQKGILPFHRNLHIYSTALYLKDQGYTCEQTIEKIQRSFQDDYVFKREALRTINSAFKGNKHFAPTTAQSYLTEEIFNGHKTEILEERTTFIVPRTFIDTLHNAKAHYNTYKLLIDILGTYQVKRESYIYELIGEKYKKSVLSHFEKLAEVGFISYAVNGDTIEAKLTHQPHDTYMSYFVVPADFMRRKTIKKMKKEFVLLVELWKSGIRFDESKMDSYVNIKESTLIKRLKTTLKTLRTCFSKLKRLRLFSDKKVQPNGSAKRQKNLIKVSFQKKAAVIGKLVSIRKAKCENEGVPHILGLLKKSVVNIIKCNYSLMFKDRTIPLIPMVTGHTLNKICGKQITLNNL